MSVVIWIYRDPQAHGHNNGYTSRSTPHFTLLGTLHCKQEVKSKNYHSDHTMYVVIVVALLPVASRFPK